MTSALKKMLQERFGDPILEDSSSLFEQTTCQGCGHMLEMDPDTCNKCGMMPVIDEKAPPGREKQVKALKKDADIDNPWAVAWSSYNRSKKNESSIDEGDGTFPEPLYYEIVDGKTNLVVGKAKTARAAKRSVDRRDNEYGGYKFQYRPVYPKGTT